MENSHRGWDEQINIWTVFQTSWYTEQFLEIPQDVIQSIASALSHAVIIMNTSSRALWLQLGVNIGLSVIQWILRFAFKRMEVIAKRGLVAPCEDDYTFFNALEPGTFEGLIWC